MGATPGNSNVLARAAHDAMGGADTVEIAWINDMRDVSPAALEHYWHIFEPCLPDAAWTSSAMDRGSGWSPESPTTMEASTGAPAAAGIRLLLDGRLPRPTSPLPSASSRRIPSMLWARERDQGHADGTPRPRRSLGEQISIVKLSQEPAAVAAALQRVDAIKPPGEEGL